MLDQPMETFNGPEIYFKSIGFCNFVKHFKNVYFQNIDYDFYFLKGDIFQQTVINKIIPVSSNIDVLRKISDSDIRSKTVVIQLSKLDGSIDSFKTIVDQIVVYCRKNDAKFVLFRADDHEEEELHMLATHHLISYREFIPVFDINKNLKNSITKHWRRLYAEA